MKKWILSLLTLFSFSLSYGKEPEKIEKLSSKVILQDTQGYFVLADGSCWKTVGFSKRWRSLSEWWNGVELVPENYECVPNDWVLGAEIEVYAKYRNLEVNEQDASNQESLKQCTHLLVNHRTGQVLFAVALETADCIVKLFKDALDEGYQKGYLEGSLDSYKNGKEIYQQGYDEGFKKGYKEGLLGE